VIPELPYSNIGGAIDWLCDAFEFTLRIRIGDHRAQLNVSDGAVVLTERPGAEGFESPESPRGPTTRRREVGHSVMVRVENVDRHHAHAKERGARILRPPIDYPYGERQYTVEDIAGHRWTFSQSIADVAPEEWGGTSSQL